MFCMILRSYDVLVHDLLSLNLCSPIIADEENSINYRALFNYQNGSSFVLNMKIEIVLKKIINLKTEKRNSRCLSMLII